MRKPAPQVREDLELPPCTGCVSRRTFCAAAGASLIALSVPACSPGDGRIGEGAIDNSGGGGVGGGPTGGGGGGGNPDMAQGGGGGGGNPDMAQGGGGNHDMAQGGGNPDLAQSGGQCASGLINAGASSSYSLNTPQHFSNGGNDILVIKDSGGIYALTALCPHAGCVVKQQSSQLYCPCHGATFDMNGQNPTSPAKSPLDHYSVCVDGSGTVWVDDSKTVSSTTRA
jgi:Rieske Fe-S protein